MIFELLRKIHADLTDLEFFERYLWHASDKQINKFFEKHPDFLEKDVKNAKFMFAKSDMDRIYEGIKEKIGM